MGSVSEPEQRGQVIFPLIVSSIAIAPHFKHMLSITLSESYLSFNNNDAPCATNACCSISPNLNAPPFALPSIGCLVKSVTLPDALA